MFSDDFEWSDIILGHYLFSLFVCVLAVVITYIVSKKYNLQTNFRGKINPNMKSTKRKSHHHIKFKKLESDDSPASSTPAKKESPALAAEKVIKANMTEEQRKLEFEVRQQQLAQIHELMMKQSDKFGNISLSDVEEQMKLYQ